MADTARRIRWLKRLALTVFVCSVLGTVGLYLLGRQARPDDDEGEAVVLDELADSASQQTGEGFDHTLMRGAEPLFRIRGSRDRQDDQGNLVVQEVEVTVFREDGTELRVFAEEATYDLDAEEASLRGRVRVEGAEGFSLSTDVLHVVAGGDAIQTDGPLDFTYGGESPLEGRADWFRANLRRDVFILRGDVEIRSQEESRPRFLVRAPRVFLERAENMLRAVDGVRVEWDDSVVLARKVTAHLGPRNREIRFLRALQEVHGVLEPRPPGDGYRRIVVQGSRLGILFDAAEPSKIELEDLDDGRSQIQAVRSDGESIEMTAGYIEAVLRDGEIERAEAVDDVVITQTLAEAVSDGDSRGEGERGKEATGPRIRRATAVRAEVTFEPQGDLRMAELQDSVHVEDGSRTLDGATVRILPDRLEAQGEPALLRGPEGELRAPRIEHHRKSALTHATGGVQALLEEAGEEGSSAPLRGTPFGRTREPIRVEAREAIFRDAPRSFLFKGAVRAWSGTDVILTEQLRGDTEPQRLSAADGVETQWTLMPKEGGEPRPIRINARTMIYEPEKDLLEYRDQVTVVEPGRRLACRILTAELGDDGDVRHMTCAERVTLESEAEGRRIEAERAEYDLTERSVRFFGEPLKMTDREGAEVECLILDYSLDEGSVRCSGSDRAAPADDQGRS
jgi:lipopolysaccharide export system protein LptA